MTYCANIAWNVKARRRDEAIKRHLAFADRFDLNVRQMASSATFVYIVLFQLYGVTTFLCECHIVHRLQGDRWIVVQRIRKLYSLCLSVCLSACLSVCLSDARRPINLRREWWEWCQEWLRIVGDAVGEDSTVEVSGYEVIFFALCLSCADK